MAKPKKYQLGRLEVTDRLQLEWDEIIVELIDRMQKYVVQAEQLARDESLELETRLTAVKHISGRLSGLVEFLQVDMRVDARKADGGLYPEELSARIGYCEKMLMCEIAWKENAPAPAGTGDER